MADTSRQGVRGIIGTTGDSQRGEQRALAARGATGALALGIIAVVLQAAATATPAWGYFTNPDGKTLSFFFLAAEAPLTSKLIVYTVSLSFIHSLLCLVFFLHETHNGFGYTRYFFKIKNNGEILFS